MTLSDMEETREVLEGIQEVEAREVLEGIQEVEIENKTGRKEKEESLENDEGNIFWIKIDGEKKLATLNLVPGSKVYKEKLVKIKDEEFRAWDPFRSKLAAAIMNGIESLPIVRKS